MDRELLLEIGVEELPASWLPGLTVQLADRVREALAEHRLKFHGTVETFSTPRRLTAVVAELADRQDDKDEVITGPPVSAARDAEGHPTPAALGFAKKNNVEFESLVELDTPKGKYLSFTKNLRGHATVDVLPDVLPTILRSIAFSKNMRWDAQLEDGKGELLFGRPIRWLLYIYGGRVVPFTISRVAGASSPKVQDVASGAVTYGHRFLATSGRAGRAIKVRSFDEYKKKLAEQFVFLLRTERRDRIVRDLDAQARKLGGRLLLQSNPQAAALLEEVPDMVEYPAVVAGAFGAEFLALPEEVLVTTLIHHQHYFPITGGNGALMPAFLAVVNTQSASDRGIATNAERVVSARLRDARFFWEADRQTTLEARLPRLETVLFHKQLGSYRQKAERIEALAKWIATTVFGASAEVAEQAGLAARLCKSDLTTDMVREFTELQGIMGGIYAKAEGLPPAVWKAIYYHYLPIAVEAEAPPKPEQLGEAKITWACVSLADKLDTLVGLFKAGEKPTGSRDPFGLRRAAQGISRILLDIEALTGASHRPTLWALVREAAEPFSGSDDELVLWLAPFLEDRLTHALMTRGFSKANVRTVIRQDWGRMRPSDLVARLKALGEIDGTEFRQLAEAFKRVRNIAKELDESVSIDMSVIRKDLKEPAELALADEIEQRQGVIDAAVRDGRNFKEAYAEAAKFQPAVAKFFDKDSGVFVMADDLVLRKARLRLMKRLEQLILQLGDITEIVAES